MDPRLEPIPIERFWPRVEFTDTCWLWEGATSNGYGSVYVGGRNMGAHRYSYAFCVGPIPQGLVIDHLCRVKRCVRPEHLEPVTNAENIRRGEGGKNKSDKTHCPAGHDYAETAHMKKDMRGNYYRLCRVCANNRQKRWLKARKEKLLATIPSVDA